MRNRIKKIICIVAVSFLTFPVTVLGQWDVGMTRARTGYLPEGTVTDILLGVMNWLLSLIGVLGVIGFAISGIMYLTSFGNESQMESAKKTMQWTAIGVAIAIVGAVIVRAVDAILTGQGQI